MISILLMSHGEMAKGMMNSCSLFFGNNIEKLKAECLMADDSPEDYVNRIKKDIEELDDGSGVIGLCDLKGGTPFNSCANLCNDNFCIISGVNLSLVLELLGLRLSHNNISEINISELISNSKDTIVCMNEIIKE